jgi:hypothetical protein
MSSFLKQPIAPMIPHYADGARVSDAMDVNVTCGMDANGNGVCVGTNVGESGGVPSTLQRVRNP